MYPNPKFDLIGQNNDPTVYQTWLQQNYGGNPVSIPSAPNPAQYPPNLANVPISNQFSNPQAFPAPRTTNNNFQQPVMPQLVPIGSAPQLAQYPPSYPQPQTILYPPPYTEKPVEKCSMPGQPIPPFQQQPNGSYQNTNGATNYPPTQHDKSCPAYNHGVQINYPGDNNPQQTSNNYSNKTASPQKQNNSVGANRSQRSLEDEIVREARALQKAAKWAYKDLQNFFK